MTINANLAVSKLELSRAAQGMRAPVVATLKAGDSLFRFASTQNPQTGIDIPSDQWARGAWWFQESDYRKIIQGYQTGNLGLGTVARSAGAVQPSWSLMNVSIKARLLDDIQVYLGAGSTQYRDELPNGMYMTLSGWPNVTQVYIPGMRGPAFAALQIIRKKIVTTNNLGFPTHQP
ncbi:hypothetical protein [Aureliella helgolandensis]|uniref:Uncharacterized protein n=1 Tax=Aureliella helgolandensis TaxID=2527968 RepID=A0A518GFY7_9BACT|nr:hypothetical protein [Aureliella helgolandensis]QDV27509.1 hypothetical protein Q31a_58980 [Aureliella helgolandensis]